MNRLLLTLGLATLGLISSQVCAQTTGQDNWPMTESTWEMLYGGKDHHASITPSTDGLITLQIAYRDGLNSPKGEILFNEKYGVDPVTLTSKLGPVFMDVDFSSNGNGQTTPSGVTFYYFQGKAGKDYYVYLGNESADKWSGRWDMGEVTPPKQDIPNPWINEPIPSSNFGTPFYSLWITWGNEYALALPDASQQIGKLTTPSGTEYVLNNFNLNTVEDAFYFRIEGLSANATLTEPGEYSLMFNPGCVLVGGTPCPAFGLTYTVYGAPEAAIVNPQGKPFNSLDVTWGGNPLTVTNLSYVYTGLMKVDDDDFFADGTCSLKGNTILNIAFDELISTPGTYELYISTSSGNIKVGNGYADAYTTLYYVIEPQDDGEYMRNATIITPAASNVSSIESIDLTWEQPVSINLENQNEIQFTIGGVPVDVATKIVTDDKGCRLSIIPSIPSDVFGPITLIVPEGYVINSNGAVNLSQTFNTLSLLNTSAPTTIFPEAGVYDIDKFGDTITLAWSGYDIKENDSSLGITVNGQPLTTVTVQDNSLVLDIKDALQEPGLYTVLIPQDYLLLMAQTSCLNSRVELQYTLNKKTSAADSILSEEETLYTVYNLQGIKIFDTSCRSDINKLPKGFYLINGKKVIIR